MSKAKEAIEGAQAIRCTRCNREVSPWPLKRADKCSPRYWAKCIRTFEAVLRDIAKEKVRAKGNKKCE